MIDAPIRQVCCRCGDLIRDGALSKDGRVSNGYCRICFLLSAEEFGVLEGSESTELSRLRASGAVVEAQRKIREHLAGKN